MRRGRGRDDELGRGEADVTVERELGEGEGKGRLVVCRACGRVLTRTCARIKVRGQHSHVCVNPSGIPFRIGCFVDAPGVTPSGTPESYWSWFPGYRWQVVVCASCQAHVGWAFLGDDGRFFGLIEARVAERDDD